MKKQISTLTGIIIIFVVAVVAFGGVFAYEYLGTKTQLVVPIQQKQVQNTLPQPKTSNSTQPTIASLQPTSGPVGTSVTITGSSFTPTSNTVYLGTMAEALASSNGTSITFTLSGCPYTTPFCPAVLIPGPQNISVSNANGTSNTRYFTVTAPTPTSQCNVQPNAQGVCPVGCVNYGVPLGCITIQHAQYCKTHECPI